MTYGLETFGYAAEYEDGRPEHGAGDDPTESEHPTMDIDLYLSTIASVAGDLRRDLARHPDALDTLTESLARQSVTDVDPARRAAYRDLASGLYSAAVARGEDVEPMR